MRPCVIQKNPKTKQKKNPSEIKKELLFLCTNFMSQHLFRHKRVGSRVVVVVGWGSLASREAVAAASEASPCGYKGPCQWGAFDQTM